MRVEVGFSAAGRRRWRRRGPLGQDSRASEARLGCPLELHAVMPVAVESGGGGGSDAVASNRCTSGSGSRRCVFGGGEDRGQD
jgi:hypothetical protein